MAKTAILKVDIISDARKANQGFDQAASKVSAFERGLAGANRAATVVGAGMIALGVQAVRAASDAQQAAGAVESVFKGNARQVTRFAENAAQAVGLSQSAYSNFAARVGSQFKNLGVPMDQLADKTNDLIVRASDLAATFGGTTADAVDALSAAFRGEFDPIERYGISIRKSDINARLAAKGLDKLEGAALKAAEAQEISAMIAEQSADAHGQFAREADTAAGQQQRLTAEWENAKAELGEALLPLLTDFAEWLSKAARWLADNKEAVKKWAVALGTAVVAIKGISAAIKTYKTISAGVKTLKALFGLGQTAAMAGQAAGVATAHATAATATSTAWATAGTASTTAVGAFAVAAGIEALVISAALIAAAVASAAAWAERSDEMAGDLGELSTTATDTADTIREAWSGVFSGAANALGWAVWNATTLGTTLSGQVGTLAEWAAAWASAGATATNAAYGVAVALGLVSIAGAPVVAMLNNAAIASQLWAAVFLGVTASIAGGLGLVTALIGGVIGAVQRALGPTGQLGNVGRLAGAAISGAMSAAAAVINGLAGAAYRVIGALQSVIAWAHSAASAVGRVRFFDGGLSARFGAVPPEVTGVAAAGVRFLPPDTVFAAANAGTYFLPPDTVFAAAAEGWLGALSGSAGTATRVDARTYITIDGALDPQAVADQVRRVLSDTDRSRGSRMAGSLTRTVGGRV